MNAWLKSVVILLVYEIVWTGLFFLGEYLLRVFNLYDLYYLLGPTIAIILLIILLFISTARHNLSINKLKILNPKSFGFLLLIVVLCRIFLDPVNNALNIIHPIEMYKIDDIGNIPSRISAIYGLNAIILIPILEESVFRGLILKNLIAKQKDTILSVVFTSLLFGLIHIDYFHLDETWPQFLSSFLFGLIVGYIYFKKRNIWICIAFHSMSNSFAFLFDDILRTEYWHTISTLDFGLAYWFICIASLVIFIPLFNLYLKHFEN